MHVGLERHGGVHRNPGDHGAGPEPHHHRLHLHLHLLHDEAAAQRSSYTRQGVCDRALGEPVQPQPRDEFRAHPHLLAIVATLHLHPDVRVLGQPPLYNPQHPLHRLLARRAQLGLEGDRPPHAQPPVPTHAAYPVSDRVL